MFTLTCEMTTTCEAEVTHIGSKGYVYCTEHAIYRRACRVERTRQLRKWEKIRLTDGLRLESYEPMRKPVSA